MFVLFLVPVASMVLPALGIAVIMGMAPKCAWVGRSLVVPRNPSIVASLRSPVALDPHKLSFRRRWWRWFNTYRWWSNTKVNRYLCGCRGRQNGRNKKSQSARPNMFQVCLLYAET